MARDQDAIRRQVLKNAPWWLQEPGEVADAAIRMIAAQLERVEASIETLFDRTFLERAEATWLDEHGRERSRYRRPDETDDAYRDRIRSWPDAVTRPAVLAGVDAVLEIGTARMEEWLPDGPFSCAAGSGDTSGFVDLCNSFTGRRGFTIYIERQVPDGNDTAWSIEAGSGTVESFAVEDTGDGVYPDDPGTFCDRGEPNLSPVYERLIDTINALKAAGVSYRVEIEEASA